MRFLTPAREEWLIERGYTEYPLPRIYLLPGGRFYQRRIVDLEDEEMGNEGRIFLDITHVCLETSTVRDSFEVEMYCHGSETPAHRVQWYGLDRESLRAYLPVLEKEAERLARRYQELFLKGKGALSTTDA